MDALGDSGTPPKPDIIYHGTHHQVRWVGAEIGSVLLEALRAGPLPERLIDNAARSALVAEMRELAVTELANETIRALLQSEPKPLAWEVGEAIAEALLETCEKVIWVWNTGRDRRTAKASLPGADLVGMYICSDGARLLFGEVKSSSDSASPPGVLFGRTGIVTQLEHLTHNNKDHWTLIKWLSPRCVSDEHRTHFRNSLQKYVASGGKDLRLVGCLIRDTAPVETDLTSRALSISAGIESPMEIMLYAWYLPDQMASWPGYVELRPDA